MGTTEIGPQRRSVQRVQNVEGQIGRLRGSIQTRPGRSSVSMLNTSILFQRGYSQNLQHAHYDRVRAKGHEDHHDEIGGVRQRNSQRVHGTAHILPPITRRRGAIRRLPYRTEEPP